MAKEIDLDDLSDEDLHYIAQRSWLVEQAMREHDIDLRPQINALLSGTKSGPEAPDPGTAATDNEEEEINYEEWTKDTLVKEISARNADYPDDEKMSTAGTKPDLIERLRADDLAASQAE